MAKKQLRKQKSPSPWAPGVWEEAAKYYAAGGGGDPPGGYPIIIGADSIFRTPEDVQYFFHLPSLPQIIETTETTSNVYGGNKNGEEDTGTRFQICDVSGSQVIDLSESAEGDWLFVWFCGRKRAAFLARSLKDKTEDADGISDHLRGVQYHQLLPAKTHAHSPLTTETNHSTSPPYEAVAYRDGTCPEPPPDEGNPS